MAAARANWKGYLHRSIFPRRIDAIHAEPQGRAVAGLRKFDRFARDGFGLALKQDLGRHGDAMTGALRLALRVP